MSGTPARYKLLLIASALDGSDISENAIAFNWASRLVARHDVTVLTYRKRDRASAREQLPGARFVEWDEWPLVGRAAKLNNLMQPYYAGFYAHARGWIREALRRGETFDVAHQLTPMAMRYPSPAIGLLPRVVIGPVAGGLPTPPGFRTEMGAEPWYVKLRSLDRWRWRYDPLLRRSMSEASVLIGALPYVRDLLSDVQLKRFEVMCELGVTTLPEERPDPGRPAGELRGLFVGRLIRTKGARDAIRALARLADMPGVTLDLVGEGEERPACEAEARRLGVHERVRFHGRVPPTEVARFYREADALIFPSFREPTGGVVLEAMSHGLPAVVADYGGPAALIDEHSGVRVPCSEPGQFADGLADAMRHLALDPGARAALGAAARERVVSHYLWQAKVDWLEELYGELVTG
jgi:glycosyltransferase involved in cell wall biosynthesis